MATFYTNRNICHICGFGTYLKRNCEMFKMIKCPYKLFDNISDSDCEIFQCNKLLRDNALTAWMPLRILYNF